MALAVVALAIFVLAFTLLLLVPIRLRIDLQGRGEPTGAWALAGGVQTGPVVVSAVAAQGVAPRSQVHVFGRPLSLGGKRKKPKPEPDKSDDEASDPLADAKRTYARITRFFDPLELVMFLVRERRRIEFGLFEVTLDYSFEDVALTGKIQGALYVLGGVFQDRVRIVQVVSWESSDRANARMSGEITLWPGRAILDTLLFVTRHVKLRKSPAARELEGSPNEQQ